MSARNTTDLPEPRRIGRSLRWPAVVVALLSVHATGMLFATFVVLQHRGESAVIPDYYQKAESWDSFRRREAVSQQLGWNIAIEPAGGLDATGHRRVHLLLTDSTLCLIDNCAHQRELLPQFTWRSGGDSHCVAGGIGRLFTGAAGQLLRLLAV